MRKQKKYHYIYKTTNLLSGRYYYGLHSTDDLEDDYLGSGTYLRRAIRKYGKENFKKEILEFCDTRKNLKKREQDIVTLQEVANKKCMNLMVGGQLGNTTSRTEMTRKKISKSSKGYIKSKKHRENLSKSLTGRTLTDEHKENLKKNHVGRTGKKWNTAYKKEAASRMIGKQHSLGYIHTHEHKKHMSELMTGRIHSDETKKKMSESKKGKIITCPQCKKSGGVSNMKRYHFDNCKTIK